MSNETRPYYAALEADSVWSAELHLAFPRDAGTRRYLPEGMGAEGSTLRAAYDRYCEARVAWEIAAGCYQAPTEGLTRWLMSRRAMADRFWANRERKVS